MKVSCLRPGDRLLVAASYSSGAPLEAVFVRRVSRTAGRAAYSLVRFPAYAGLPVASPDGVIQMSDYDLSRRGVLR